MTNLLDDPIYVTWQDVLDTTTIAGLIALLTWTPTAADGWITQAQRIIDNYIGRYGTPFDEDQTFVFPVEDDDGASLIPIDIQLATIQIVEMLYLQGDTTLSSLSTQKVKSEKNIWRSVTYEDSATTETIQVPQKTQNILNNYKGNLFTWQVV